jgi:hypothetical protein
VIKIKSVLFTVRTWKQYKALQVDLYVFLFNGYICLHLLTHYIDQVSNMPGVPRVQMGFLSADDN